MEHYQGDPYEREPLDSHDRYDEPQPSPPHGAHAFSRDSSYRDDQSRQQSFDRVRSHGAGHSRTNSFHNGAVERSAPPPPPHRSQRQRPGRSSSSRGGPELGYAQSHSNITPGADNFSQAAAGGMAGIAYSVADRNARESGVEALRSTGQVPPPPSRAQFASNNGMPSPNSSYDIDPAAYTQNLRGPDSHTSLRPLGAVASPYGRSNPGSASHSPSRSTHNSGSDIYADDPYQGFSSKNGDPRFGMVDPDDIEDDGDDGLHYPRNSNRNSMLSSHNSDRGARAGATAAAAVGGAAAGGAMGGLLSRKGYGPREFDRGPEKSSEWMEARRAKNKRWRWAVIIGVGLVVCGAIIGGVVGGFVNGSKHGDKSASEQGESASADSKKNGDLSVTSDEIKKLMNNPDLHKVFPGMDYTPLNTQYPDCIHNPPSQNNITRDVAVLSQLTNKIRLYGTDCNQTEMVLHAIDRLKMKDSMKVWLGVWQDDNSTTNARQLRQMWDVLDKYGDDPFEGIIIANEVLYREDMTVSQLGDILSNARKNLTSKGLKLEVATSDLGDDWTSTLAEDSEYIMANIHPFFAGVEAKKAAAWTSNFWQQNDGQYWKKDKSKNIISETGWPSDGGQDCGGAQSCSPGAVAGIDEMNTFMNDWVCNALDNGTMYFWFEAFDEPWKVMYNTKGKEWEDKWGLMDVNRNLKKGVKIPDCGGKTVS